MRLIDADKLCMHLSDWQFGSMTDGKHDAEYEVINKVIDGIEKEQTVDAVSVVQCKDCRWWDKKDGANYGYCHAAKHGYFSKHWEISIYRTYGPDFYCADGERKEE